MAEWTPGARAELERHGERVRASLASAGADPAEVLEDLRRHIDEEAAAAQLAAVTEEDVRRILARMGAPDAPAPPGPSDPRSRYEPLAQAAARGGPDLRPDPASPAGPGRFFLFYAVLPAAAALLVEISTGMCAGGFFDPVPTVWHALLIACVPAANLAVWLALRSRRTTSRRALGLANGVALGVSFFYTLLFLPLLPFSLFAVIAYGLGLLPLSPLLSFLGALQCRRHLRRLGGPVAPPRAPGLRWGVALSLVLLVAIEVPETLTRIGLKMAASPSAGTRQEGVRWLRAVGDRDVMLRACYERPQRATDLIGLLFTLGDPVQPDAARRIWYLATGTPFNSVPAPRLRSRGGWAFDDFDWDPDQGGEAVAGRVRGLSLAASRLDGSIDADAALAYVEWTLTFRNASWGDREARARLALPPGGVVSRVTLWVNGEEREAAFAARSRAREAYRQVAVVQRRDPVLVTTQGPDRVLVQCFPVPRNGGEMKVRIGVTAPLVLDGPEKGLLRLPVIQERNFGIGPEARHEVWVESKRPVASPAAGLRPERAGDALHAVRGALSDADLLDAGRVQVLRDAAVVEAWTPDPGAPGGDRVIRQALAPGASPAPPRVVLAVDGSASTRSAAAGIATALERLPEATEIAVVMAGDDVIDLAPPAAGKTAAAAAAQRVTEFPFEGGRDNVPALARAWDLAAERPGAVILWVHGPQPVLIEPADGLRQRWDRRPDGPRLLDLQVRGGTDVIVDKLDGLAGVETVAALGAPTDSLRRLVDGWAGVAPPPAPVRESLARDAYRPPAGAKETSAHLARLWARDEVTRRSASRAPGAVEAAVAMAVRYQIVTPVSGAVVLETKQQYDQAGLTPVDPSTVPTIPEPGVWLMALVAVAAVLAAARARPARA